MMRRSRAGLFGLIVLLLAVHTTTVSAESLDIPSIGKVEVWKPVGRPAAVVLLVADDGAWKRELPELARELERRQIMVVGIPLSGYTAAAQVRKENCVWPGVDFERVSRAAEKLAHLKEYIHPVVGGYRRGADLAYAGAAQASPGMFAGLVTLGLCPGLKPPVPVCSWEEASSQTSGPRPRFEWRAFPGSGGESCTPTETAAFIDSFPYSIYMDKPARGEVAAAIYGLGRRAERQPKKADHPLADLPLAQFPVRNARDPLVVIYSGDGGWAGLDRQLARFIQQRGHPVLGVDSLRYFWTLKSPTRASADLARFLEYYTSAWHVSRVVLIGWSMGADVLPFLVNRLPEDLQKKIEFTLLLGPSRSATFEFHLSEWFSRWRDEMPGNRVLPEVEKIRGSTRVILVCGENDRNSLCTEVKAGHVAGVSVVYMGKGHHFDGERKTLPQKVAQLVGIR